VVTNPIAKSVLYRAGFRHPGHTEFLAELAANGGVAPQPVMMLWSPALAVVPVTIHLSVREALAELSTDSDRHDGADRGCGPQSPLWASPGRGLPCPASIRMRAKTAHSGWRISRWWRRRSKSCAARASRARGAVAGRQPCSTKPREKNL